MFGCLFHRGLEVNPMVVWMPRAFFDKREILGKKSGIGEQHSLKPPSLIKAVWGKSCGDESRRVGMRAFVLCCMGK
ncbi:hypothetical protein [Bartonella tribocorum]|uniref:Uncharacterized protein n=1 Tax=Bartonella tribocorum TaxID=85701 RepID=A0A2N9Y8V9_9HYPH|nr:hypothetical protein [Bartonella tribocorum]PIT68142.1 hypothetical protein CER18_08285 [Bartonella tribocorum]